MINTDCFQNTIFIVQSVYQRLFMIQRFVDVGIFLKEKLIVKTTYDIRLNY